MYFLFVLFVEEVGVDLCDYITFDVVELHMYYTLSRWAASSHLSESTQLFARSTETTYWTVCIEAHKRLLSTSLYFNLLTLLNLSRKCDQTPFGVPFEIIFIFLYISKVFRAINVLNKSVLNDDNSGNPDRRQFSG